jgi:hypothetical protein
MYIYHIVCFNNWHLDEVKVSWDKKLVNLFIKKCNSKSYCNDIKYHKALNKIYSVLPKMNLNQGCIVVNMSWEVL